MEFSQILADPKICKLGLGEGNTVTCNGIELPKQFTEPVLDSFTTMVEVPGVVQFTEMVLPIFDPTIVPPVTVQLKDDPGVGLFIVYCTGAPRVWQTVNGPVGCGVIRIGLMVTGSTVAALRQPCVFTD